MYNMYIFMSRNMYSNSRCSTCTTTVPGCMVVPVQTKLESFNLLSFKVYTSCPVAVAVANATL